MPGSYAMQAYDTAMLIDSALQGDRRQHSPTRRRSRRRSARPTSSPSAARSSSTPTAIPIQDFYLVKVAKRADGKFQTEIVEKVFENYGDAYAKDCKPSELASSPARDSAARRSAG